MEGKAEIQTDTDGVRGGDRDRQRQRQTGRETMWHQKTQRNTENVFRK
jgi:hypothetical protein